VATTCRVALVALKNAAHPKWTCAKVDRETPDNPTNVEQTKVVIVNFVRSG
jgi:hypothetical protein